MKKKILHELGTSSSLLLWLSILQFLSAFFSVIAMLVLALTGIMPLVGPTPLWGWIAGGVLACLLWLMAGRLTSRVVRPGPVGAVVVLVIWAAVTFLLSNTPLLFTPQELCGGMLEQLLGLRDHSSWVVGKLVPCFLLPAAFGAGLLLGRKRAAAAGAALGRAGG